jgi:hypothetical protein
MERLYKKFETTVDNAKAEWTMTKRYRSASADGRKRSSSGWIMNCAARPAGFIHFCILSKYLKNSYAFTFGNKKSKRP